MYIISVGPKRSCGCHRDVKGSVLCWRVRRRVGVTVDLGTRLCQPRPAASSPAAEAKGESMSQTLRKAYLAFVLSVSAGAVVAALAAFAFGANYVLHEVGLVEDNSIEVTSQPIRDLANARNLFFGGIGP
jgi:hypothetical protein